MAYLNGNKKSERGSKSPSSHCYALASLFLKRGPNSGDPKNPLLGDVLLF